MSPSRQPWPQGPMCAFDLETTGVKVAVDRIVTAATVSIRPGETPQSTSWLLNPGVEIPDAAAAVHGITTATARTQGVEAGPAVETICLGLAAEAAEGVPLVVFNAPYDLTLLEYECRRYGLPTLTERCKAAGVDLYVIDPLVLDRALVPKRRGKRARTLEALTGHYGIDLTAEEAHTADGDALATARLAWRIGRAYVAIASMSLPNLMRFQAEHHAKWAQNFEWFLRERKGEADASISREWPITTAKTGAST